MSGPSHERSHACLEHSESATRVRTLHLVLEDDIPPGALGLKILTLFEWDWKAMFDRPRIDMLARQSPALKVGTGASIQSGDVHARFSFRGDRIALHRLAINNEVGAILTVQLKPREM
jgi:uncharacterized protein (UPF0248 family)